MSVFPSMYKDQLSLESILLFLSQGYESFVFFVNNVPIKKDVASFQIKDVLAAIDKCQEAYQMKLLRPYRTLLMRMLDAYCGFTELHLQFLILCFKYSAPFQALPILQYPALFTNLKKSKSVDFLSLGAKLFCLLNMYQSAYDMIVKLFDIQFVDLESIFTSYKYYAVLSVNLGKAINPEFKDKYFTSAKSFEKQRQYKQKFIDYVPEVEFFMNMKEWSVLKPEQKNILLKYQLLDIFDRAQQRSLGNYIQDSVKQKNWRIKADSIKNTKIGDFRVIKQINTPNQIYKYDSKEGIMYFNHQKCNQQSLNQLISKALIMQNEVTNCKIDRAERSDFGGRFGGMGMGMGMGMGGFLGGMGKRRSHDRQF